MIPRGGIQRQKACRSPPTSDTWGTLHGDDFVQRVTEQATKDNISGYSYDCTLRPLGVLITQGKIQSVRVNYLHLTYRTVQHKTVFDPTRHNKHASPVPIPSLGYDGFPHRSQPSQAATTMEFTLSPREGEGTYAATPH